MEFAFDELPTTYPSTRDALHRVAAHILGRRRAAITDRFGLRASHGGFTTPAFGDDAEVVRVSGEVLAVERDRRTRLRPLRGAALADLAAFVDVDLRQDFSVGRTTPPQGDVDAALPIDPPAAAALVDWFAFGTLALDAALAALGDEADASIVQLWPEHFDVGCDVAAGAQRANLGASPGDEWSGAPYVYVGPWAGEPDGDFWNAPFGAALVRTELEGVADPLDRVVAFLSHGVALLRD